MGILKHLNWKWLTTVPYALGDRYYVQDLIRDFRFLQDTVGVLAYDTFGQIIPRKISGGVVTKGAGDTLNITLGRGWVAHSVEIPNTFASIPPSKMSADVTGVPLSWGAQTNMAIPLATLNGVATNYVKVRYFEADGNTRVRAKSAGTYYYESVPYYQFVVDTVAPTVYDLVLTSFVGTSGGSFSIANPAMAWPYWSELSSIPLGSVLDYAGLYIPDCWLIADGSSLLRSSYASLWSKLSLPRGAATISNASPAVVSLSNHGQLTGDCIHITTTGTLPTGLSPSTDYFVVVIGVNSFSLATSYDNALAGVKINTSSAGSGVHSVTWIPWGAADSTHFYLPDLNGVSSEGSGQQTHSSWAGPTYVGRVGQYKQDQIQGFYLAPSNETTKRLVVEYVNYGVSGIGADSNKSTPIFATSATGLDASAAKPVADGTNGNPRTGTKTATPRVGVYKIIKVV